MNLRQKDQSQITGNEIVFEDRVPSISYSGLPSKNLEPYQDRIAIEGQLKIISGLNTELDILNTLVMAHQISHIELVNRIANLDELKRDFLILVSRYAWRMGFNAVPITFMKPMFNAKELAKSNSGEKQRYLPISTFVFIPRGLQPKQIAKYLETETLTVFATEGWMKVDNLDY